MSASNGLAQLCSGLEAEITRSDPPWPTVVTTAAVVASLQIGYLTGIGIRSFLESHRQRANEALYSASSPRTLPVAGFT
jgi:hypothetical protein